MVYIVHGDDYAKSRKLVVNQFKKSSNANRVDIDISDISPQKLGEICQTQSLFGEGTFVVCQISNNVRDTEYIKILTKIPATITLILLAPTKLLPSNIFLKNAKDIPAKIVESAIDKNSNVFKFVDSVFEQNRQQAYKEYQKLITEGENDYYLFTMLLYNLRNISVVKFESPKVQKMNRFVVQKAKKFAGRFSDKSIKTLFHLFYEAEKDIKSGNISDNLATTYIIEKILTCHEKKDISKRL